MNLLAAVVLYIVAVGNVRGFAFTLGLTAVIDLIIVYGLTHPLLVVLSRTKFFAEGHRWSGLDPSLLARCRCIAGPGRSAGSTRTSPRARQEEHQGRRRGHPQDDDRRTPGRRSEPGGEQ